MTLMEERGLLMIGPDSDGPPGWLNVIFIS